MRIEIPPYCCDVCKKRRDSDANHWFVLMPTEACQGLIYLAIFRWVESNAEDKDAAHACGQEHALTLTSRWLSKGNFGE